MTDGSGQRAIEPAGRQHSFLFDGPPTEDPADARNRLKKVLVSDIQAQPLSREQIADKLTALSGKNVTRAIVDAWTSETKTHRFPADLIPFWCQVVQSTRILEFVAARAGYYVADQTEHDLAEFARAALQVEKIQRHQSNLKRKLAGRF